MKMRNGTSASLFFAGLLILCVNGIAHADLIGNGSFESGSFTPVQSDNSVRVEAGGNNITDWAVIGHNIGWGQSPAWGLSASDGQYFLDLTGWYDHAPSGGVSQTIATTVGQAYTLSFDLAAFSSTYPVSVLAAAGGTSESFNWAGTASTNEWHSFSLDFVADSANTTISIIGTGVASDVWYIGLDNVSVESKIVPVPGAVLLGMLGLGAAGAKLRKCRSA